MEVGSEENRTRWRRIEEIYHAALTLGVAERQAFVLNNCAGDSALQDDLFTLLAADDEASDFLREPIAELGFAVLADENFRVTEPGSGPIRASFQGLTGTIIAGRYEVIERLGGGGFGDVYRATDLKVMSRPVVVKVLREDALEAEVAKREWVITKFQQEIEALSKIEDPGVVGIFDADTLPDSRPYIVMEFVRGTNLRSFIDKAGSKGPGVRGLKFQDVAEILRQVGRTLTAAHEVEVYHRDLKPENIMLRRSVGGDLQIKVIDFGIAKVRNSLVASSTATGLFWAGTGPYMSPEQARGKRIWAASDIYAMGVIAYELVTGHYPFPARDLSQLKELQEGGVKVNPRHLNPDLPAAAEDVMLKALSFYPEDRQKRACDFGEEFARALASSEELVRPAPPQAVDLEGPTLKDGDPKNRDDEQVEPVPPPDTGRGSWFHRQRGPVLAACIVLVAGIVGFIAWRYSKSAPAQSTAPNPAAADSIARAERTLTYWLSVKRPRDADAFDSAGERIFDSGSQFWFNVQASQEGALYLFGEGHDRNGPSELNTMYPTLASGNGDARLPANKIGSVTGKPFQFRGDSGIIYLWVIWSDKPVVLLDVIVRKSYDTKGTITDPSQQAALRTFLERYKEPKPEIQTTERPPRVTLRGRGRVLVDVRKLEYQP